MTTVDEEMTTLPAVVAAAADEEASVTKEDLPPYLLQDFEAAEGLTTEAYQKRLAEHGPNEVKIVEKPVWWQIASRFLGLVPLFITTTAVLSAAIESQCSEDLDVCECNDLRDWASFVLLLVELNLVVYADYTGSKSSGNAMAALQAASASQVGVRRDGAWTHAATRELVPGDMVAITIGMTIPADGVVVSEGEPLKLDYSSLTGEPLPEKKGRGEALLSGAVVLVGEGEMIVTRTGVDSSLGTTQALIAQARQEKEAGGQLAATLSRLVIFLSIFGVTVAVFVGAYGANDFNYSAGEAIKQAFVLLSTILPVTMPLILTTTLAVGAQELAADDAVVQRFSAIPEMANMDILCSDKTGTLTLGKMTCITEESIVFDDTISIEYMMELALVASRIEHSDAIDAAITKYFDNPADVHAKYEITKFIPFDPTTKRVEAVAKHKATGEEMVIVKGAPPVLMNFSGIDGETYERAQKALNELSGRGYKTLAVSLQVDENEWKLLGLIAILDPPRSDTAHTVQKCIELGVDVKMITGDQRLIAIEVARQLKLPSLAIFDKEAFQPNSSTVAQAGGFGALCEKAGGFAGVSPEHKHRVVTALQQRGHFVGMTGDGVNDAPALSIANVGIAVAGATDAARGASDIVLQREGLATIVKALYGSRIIFKRIEAYLTYRLCSSFIFGMTFTLIYVASGYNFPTWTLILMSLLNDFAVSSSSKDQVVIQREPVALNIWKVGTTALVMAVISSLEVWGLVQSILNNRDDHFWGLKPQDEDDGFTGCEVAAFTFLSLIITVQLNLLVARSPKPFFMLKTEKDDAGHFTAVPPPSPHVLGAIALSLTIATLIAVYWDDNITIGSGFGMQGIGWRNSALVWCWGLLWFVIIDLAKSGVLLLWKAVEEDKDGTAFFRNVMELGGEDGPTSAQRIATLRQSLRKFDTKLPATPASSRILDQGLSAALAVIAQDDQDDSASLVTAQDFLLAAETLQNDPNLMRLVSRLFFDMAQMQARLDQLEGTNTSKKSFFHR